MSTPTSVRPLSTGVRVATVIVTMLAAIGLAVTILFLIGSLVDPEGMLWYIAFAVISSIASAVPAIAALVLGIVGRRRGVAGVPLAGIIVGAIVLVILITLLIFLAVA